MRLAAGGHGPAPTPTGSPRSASARRMLLGHRRTGPPRRGQRAAHVDAVDGGAGARRHQRRRRSGVSTPAPDGQLLGLGSAAPALRDRRRLGDGRRRSIPEAARGAGRRSPASTSSAPTRADALEEFFRTAPAADWQERLLPDGVTCVVVEPPGLPSRHVALGRSAPSTDSSPPPGTRTSTSTPALTAYTTFSRSRSVLGPGARVGEHTDAVLAELAPTPRRRARRRAPRRSVGDRPSALGSATVSCVFPLRDPLLSGALAAAFVRGAQSQGVATTVKHFVGNDAEFERLTIELGDRRAHPARALPACRSSWAVREGGSLGVMTGYNRVNGTWCAEHGELLAGVLRDEWGFEGFVVTDWYSVGVDGRPRPAAGLDLEMPGPGRAYGAVLAEAVRAGTVDEAALDARWSPACCRCSSASARSTTPATRCPRRSTSPPTAPSPVRRPPGRSSCSRTTGVLPLDASALTLRWLAVIGPTPTAPSSWAAARLGPCAALPDHAARGAPPSGSATASRCVHEPGVDITRTAPTLAFGPDLRRSGPAPSGRGGGRATPSSHRGARQAPRQRDTAAAVLRFGPPPGVPEGFTLARDRHLRPRVAARRTVRALPHPGRWHAAHPRRPGRSSTASPIRPGPGRSFFGVRQRQGDGHRSTSTPGGRSRSSSTSNADQQRRHPRLQDRRAAPCSPTTPSTRAVAPRPRRRRRHRRRGHRRRVGVRGRRPHLDGRCPATRTSSIAAVSAPPTRDGRRRQRRRAGRPWRGSMRRRPCSSLVRRPGDGARRSPTCSSVMPTRAAAYRPPSRGGSSTTRRSATSPARRRGALRRGRARRLPLVRGPPPAGAVSRSATACRTRRSGSARRRSSAHLHAGHRPALAVAGAGRQHRRPARRPRSSSATWPPARARARSDRSRSSRPSPRSHLGRRASRRRSASARRPLVRLLGPGRARVGRSPGPQRLRPRGDGAPPASGRGGTSTPAGTGSTSGAPRPIWPTSPRSRCRPAPDRSGHRHPADARRSALGARRSALGARRSAADGHPPEPVVEDGAPTGRDGRRPVTNPRRNDGRCRQFARPEYLDLLRLDERKYVVVGAGQGMGRQTCHALTQAGAAKIVCVDIDEERAKDIAEEIGIGVPWVGRRDQARRGPCASASSPRSSWASSTASSTSSAWRAGRACSRSTTRTGTGRTT